jgi:Skp family chaperone for outer membrane proteins
MERNNQSERTLSPKGLTCVEFDTLLSDALDGVLSAATQRNFDLHREQCPTCGPLFRETAAGMTWLESLEEVEPPVNLVHNILAATTLQPGTVAAQRQGWKQSLSGKLSELAAPFRAVARQPRLVMTAAMALFSVALSLNIAGIHLGDLKHVDLRPSAIKEQATMRYYETSSRVVKYYENIRLVYEVESKLQELKRSTGEDEPEQRPADRKKTENEKKDRQREQNYYSRTNEHIQLAGWRSEELNQSSMNQVSRSPRA